MENNSSKRMSKIKSQNTSIEIKLRKELWKKGYRYRINCKNIFGKPDICFISQKIAIFCDSEFWHGKKYLEGKQIPKNNKDFWEKKFLRNIERDKEVNEHLKKEGWIVIRFWDVEINKHLDDCIEKIEKHLNINI